MKTTYLYQKSEITNKSTPNLTKAEFQHYLNMGKLLQTKAPEKIEI
jgi:hypothetical protein